MKTGKSYITPPGLQGLLESFDIHFRVADDSPILLVGPSGVGKSVFIAKFKELYKNKKGEKSKLLYLDCSHFVGADSSLARSELFGHKKGAFTGATSDKAGLIKNANSGALILDEIGELQENVQAMLLTFVETGKFRPIGSDTEESASVQIVAATNREDKLREELRFRFFPFYISPLHKRRIDVLYYFAIEFEDFFKQLHSWEIFALLGYNWPGNVREINRIGKLMQCNRIRLDNFESVGLKRSLLFDSPLRIHDERLTGLDLLDVLQFWFELKNQYGIDVGRLEKVLNRYSCGLDPNSGMMPFNLDKPVIDEEGFITKEYQDIFDRIERGFDTFSLLMCLAGDEAENFFKMKNRKVNSLFQHDLLLEVNKNDKDIESLVRQFEKYLSSFAAEGEMDCVIGEQSYEEMQILYFNNLLERANGNQTKAAEKANLPSSTFRSKLKRLGISPPFKPFVC